ncbi:MAG: hypothetical protein KME29_13715 [Calothrix sp. FI2-JRJ7]|jgi:hypothetical protein|nr:hypothetical protein [Calothrix sp. FI2-JRJ7]
MLKDYNNHNSNSSQIAAPSGNAAIIPLQPEQVKPTGAWETLAEQARQINRMAQELEEAILEFKTIAGSINNHPAESQQKSLSKSWCKYFAISVPCVRQRTDKTFVMTTRKVDLFRLEREAASLAQDLRDKNSRKRLPQVKSRRK